MSALFSTDEIFYSIKICDNMLLLNFDCIWVVPNWSPRNAAWWPFTWYQTCQL